MPFDQPHGCPPPTSQHPLHPPARAGGRQARHGGRDPAEVAEGRGGGDGTWFGVYDPFGIRFLTLIYRTPNKTQEPDVLARLFDLLRNWADSHKRGRPRIAMEFVTDLNTAMPLTAAATTVLMG